MKKNTLMPIGVWSWTFCYLELLTFFLIAWVSILTGMSLINFGVMFSFAESARE